MERVLSRGDGGLPSWAGIAIVVVLVAASLWFTSFKAAPPSSAQPAVVPASSSIPELPSASKTESSSNYQVQLSGSQVQVAKTVSKGESTRIESYEVSNGVPDGAIVLLFVPKPLASSAKDIQSTLEFYILNPDPAVYFKVSKAKGTKFELFFPGKSDKATAMVVLEPEWANEIQRLNTPEFEGLAAGTGDSALFAAVSMLLNKRESNGKMDFGANVQAALAQIAQVPKAAVQPQTASLSADELALYVPVDGGQAMEVQLSLNELLGDGAYARYVKNPADGQILQAKFSDDADLPAVAQITSADGDSLTLAIDKPGLIDAVPADEFDSESPDAGISGTLQLLLPAGAPGMEFMTSRKVRIIPASATPNEVMLPGDVGGDQAVSEVASLVADSPDGTAYYLLSKSSVPEDNPDESQVTEGAADALQFEGDDVVSAPDDADSEAPTMVEALQSAIARYGQPVTFENSDFFENYVAGGSGASVQLVVTKGGGEATATFLEPDAGNPEV
ncbi:hypothetical protein HY095_06025 [Candidatus Micrarchaeota archaeon]|nr:hypothetical protein [Candidatus Micrarchaeota archaeon]